MSTTERRCEECHEPWENTVGGRCRRCGNLTWEPVPSDRPAGTAAKIDEFLHHARVRDLADADLLALRAEVADAIAADADR